MRVDRRALLKLAGASCLTAAIPDFARAETPGSPGDLPFALTTPIHVGEVALKVRDLALVQSYYESMLGLSELRRDGETVVLGAGGHPLLHLVPHADAALEPPTEAGLFHVAYLMPNRAELARWLVHVAMSQVPVSGFADHNVSEAVYLTDPEGNGVEVYADRPKDSWTWEGDVVTMGTQPLNIDDILALADTTRDTFERAPAGLSIGHMHLRVGDIAEARAFYETKLGLASTRGERADAAFLSSGRYHHHVAMNVWNSAGAGARDATRTGLDWFSLVVRDGAEHAALVEKVGASDLKDPWGTTVRLARA